MGLLDRAEKLNKSAEEKLAAESKVKKPSLLEKAQKFLSEEENWIEDLSTPPASRITGDLPTPDNEEVIDLSDLPDFPSAVDNTAYSEDDTVPEMDMPSEDEPESDEGADDPTEPESEDDQAKEPTEELPEIKDEGPAPLPEVDLFDAWETDAIKESAKQPIRPVTEDQVSTNERFLFDDESDFSTAPMGQYLASNKRIENYQAVFEITKEIAASKEFSDFFDNLVYSIIGQVGSSSVVILSSTKPDSGRWDALTAEGINVKENWSLLANDEIYQRLSDSDSVIYAGELKQSRIPDKEKRLLIEMESEILVPIRHKDQCYGILSLGKLINGEEYIVDDLEFVKVVGEIAGSVFVRVYEFEKLNEELANIKEVVEINESVLKSARDFAGVRKMDDAYDLLVENLKQKLGVKQFSFLVLDSETRTDYTIFGSNFILPERAKDFRLSKDSDIVGMVSNVPGVYKLENFQEDSELKSIFTNDELGIMSEFTILPIINLNWLVAMIVIHSTVKPWTDMTRDVAVAMAETSAPVFANLLILSEKEALFRNPFNPLETKIISEIEKADQMKLSFTVSLFKIQNVVRMIHLFGAGKFARYADALRKTIVDHIDENDFFTRVGQGKFAVILHGKDKEETDIVLKKIKASFTKREEFFSSTFKPSYRILSLSYPGDTKDKNQFMEMIEEA